MLSMLFLLNACGFVEKNEAQTTQSNEATIQECVQQKQQEVIASETAENITKNKEIVVELRYIVLYVFYLYYIKVFTEIIFEKNIKWRNVIKKCNNILVFSMLLLTTFQQWYLIWLFTIIMWQNNKKINRLLSITIITELANAIYMYKSEWYIYDGIFVMTIICLFILNIFTQKILQNFRKEQKDEKKQKV